MTRVPHPTLRDSVPSCLRAFSLIEMMIAIVILGLGLVMTATMFPVAWTRARTLTEYTTQRVIAQSAAATIATSLRPAGSSFTAYDDPATSSKTGKYFISTGSLAGDLFYDPVLHADGDPSLRLPCNPPNQCYSHLSVLIPSDTRVHALHMQNLHLDGNVEEENPYLVEKTVELCRRNGNQLTCRTEYPLADPAMKCDNPINLGAEFCSRSFYSPQVNIAARMYPPIEAPPVDISSPAFPTWIEKFNSRRYSWAALHRLRTVVGPVNVPPPPLPLPVSNSTEMASQAATATGTTRAFDFYIVTLKRPSSTSRYAVQDPASSPTINPDSVQLANPAAKLLATDDVALPVAWRVQVEFPVNVKSRFGANKNPPDPPTGIPTEIQVPPTGVTTAPLVVGMFPNGTQFIDEITGQIYRVVGRRVSLDAQGNPKHALLTLDREFLVEDLDNSFAMGGDSIVQPVDAIRTVWVFPPPISERTEETIAFDDSSPVVGIDIRTISMTPPG